MSVRRKAASPHEGERRRVPRRWLGALLALVVVAAAAGTAAAARSQDAEPTGTSAPTGTARVERRDLVVTEELDGELAYADERTVATPRSGVVTSVVVAGSTVSAGEALYAVDLEPTVLLVGSVPAFRDLDEDVADGPDVQQLEQALVDLGFGADLVVDTSFTSATEDAVEAWEESLGRRDPDGTVELGDVVFATGPLRVVSVQSAVGAQVQAGSSVLTATATDQVVEVALAADRSGELAAGTAVTVTLPDGTAAPATIRGVGTEVQSDAADPDSEPTVTVVVALDDPAAAASYDSGAVDVTVEDSREDGALAVPVTALVGLSEGGYAVEVVSGGARRLVAVEVGTVADGWASVEGDVAEGDEVVVPA